MKDVFELKVASVIVAKVAVFMSKLQPGLSSSPFLALPKSLKTKMGSDNTHKVVQ